jgi:hypothetical protein
MDILGRLHMARWIVAGLVVLNLVLGAGVWMRLGGERKAYGQIGAVKPDFASVSGFTNNATTIFLLEVSTGRLAAVQVDITGRRIAPVSSRNVADDLARLK